jgi:hypothetical protein
MSKRKVVNTLKSFVRKSETNGMFLTLNNDGTSLEGCGDQVWVRAMDQNPALFEELKVVLVAAARNVDPEDSLMVENFPKKYPKLFACPGSKQWKGKRIRSQLSKYLEFHGFGRNMPKKYGEDDPPTGWPVLLDWSSFKGPSKSCSLGLCTEIIKQMMEAQDLDPMDHFVKEGDHDDHEEEGGDGDYDDDEVEEEGDVDESDQSQEEEDPQPGPSKKRKLDNVVKKIAKVQQKENEENLALARQKKNKEDIMKGLANLEEGELSDSS